MRKMCVSRSKEGTNFGDRDGAADREHRRRSVLPFLGRCLILKLGRRFLGVVDVGDGEQNADTA